MYFLLLSLLCKSSSLIVTSKEPKECTYKLHLAFGYNFKIAFYRSKAFE